MMMTTLGSLWTSILKPGVFLSGASGGVYALITGGAILQPFQMFSFPIFNGFDKNCTSQRYFILQY